MMMVGFESRCVAGSVGEDPRFQAPILLDPLRFG